MFKAMLFGIALLAGGPAAFAQVWPAKPMRIVVPFPPGGGTDIGTRILAQKLQEAWGQAVVVENKPGAAGIVGTELIAKSAPDGYTFMMGNIGTHAINVSLYKQLSYDPVKDFAPVSMVADLISGQVPLSFATVLETIQFVKAGKVRALAVTNNRRSVALPDLPTISESGLPGYQSISWLALFAPAGTPKDIVNKASIESVRILNLPDVRERLLAQGAEPIGSTPEQLASILAGDIAKYARVIRESGYKPE